MIHLREKQEAGASFLVSQLFFENSSFLRFLERARTAGVRLPVSAGVMPILSRGQIERMIFMCGASLPSEIIRLLHKYERSPEDLRKAGVEHAIRQMEGLVREGAQGIHVYTMNHPDIAASAIGRLRSR
jgi:methylenetetrahydrofolate reductase (NADPH)